MCPIAEMPGANPSAIHVLRGSIRDEGDGLWEDVKSLPLRGHLKWTDYKTKAG